MFMEYIVLRDGECLLHVLYTVLYTAALNSVPYGGIHTIMTTVFSLHTVRRFKGSVSRDFRPPVFFMIRTHLGP